MKLKKGLVWPLIASLIIGLLATSCSSSFTESVDEDRREKFVDLLVDVQLLEAALKQKAMPKPSTDSIMAVNYKLIFQDHGITQEHYNTEFDYWKSQPAEMAIIYAELVERLNKMDGELRAKAEEEN
jgi:hypothetical protein